MVPLINRENCISNPNNSLEDIYKACSLSEIYVKNCNGPLDIYFFKIP